MAETKKVEPREFETKLRAIEAHCKQRGWGEWPLALDDKFIALMNDVAQYFPYEIPSTKELLGETATKEE